MTSDNAQPGTYPQRSLGSIVTGVGGSLRTTAGGCTEREQRLERQPCEGGLDADSGSTVRMIQIRWKREVMRQHNQQNARTQPQRLQQRGTWTKESVMPRETDKAQTTVTNHTARPGAYTRRILVVLARFFGSHQRSAGSLRLNQAGSKTNGPTA